MDELCPPYWPRLPWLFFHPHHPDPDPGPLRKIDPAIFAQLDSHFAAIAIGLLAGRLSDKKLADQIGGLAGKASSEPMPGIAR